jgi:hypothetical protein
MNKSLNMISDIYDVQRLINMKMSIKKEGLGEKNLDSLI